MDWLIILLVLVKASSLNGCVQEKKVPSHSEKPPESTATREPARELGSSVPLGIGILPCCRPSGWTNESFTEAFRLAREGGVRIGVWRHQWGDLEPMRGSYAWGDLDYEVYKTKQQGMQLSPVIEVIHTNALGRFPEGVVFTKFDDPVFMEAFRSFINALLKRYSGKISHLWIGNEVNYYLNANKEQVVPFLNLYQEVERAAKSIDLGIKMGIVAAYHLARNTDGIELIRTLTEEGDAIGMTLYTEDDDARPDVAETENYYEEMLRALPGKEIAVIETAWSSAGPGGSTVKQAEYVKNVAQVLEKHADRFILFSWFMLYNLQEELNQEAALGFEVPLETEAGQEFLRWQGSLGLLQNNGTAKAAWMVWKKEMTR